MKWSYGCPKCKALLNPNQSIMLVAQKDNEKVLAGFHPEPGNYEIYFPPQITIEKGDKWTFTCPVCQADLTSEEDAELSELELIDGEETSKVLFSRIAGQKATFVVDQQEGKLKSKHGIDAESLYHYLALIR